jgi:hypothetical protein
MQSQDPASVVQWLHAASFANEGWFHERYEHRPHIPGDPAIDWEAICQRWRADHPAHTLIAEAEDRARCLIDPWAEARLVYVPEGRLRDPFDYHAMEYLGWQPVRAGQDAHQGLLYAPLEDMLAWLRTNHISPDFLAPGGGPWCPLDAAAHCPGCAGQLGPAQR